MAWISSWNSICVEVTAVHWQILSNKYDSIHSDTSAFKVTQTDSGHIRYTGDHLENAYSTAVADIIKCSITVVEQQSETDED